MDNKTAAELADNKEIKTLINDFGEWYRYS
jgi:hypothetical protein